MRSALTVTLFAIAAMPASAREHRFLAIWQPLEGDRYTATSTIALNGYLYLPGREDAPESVVVRVRLLRPADGKLVLAQAGEAKVRRLGQDGPGEYTFLLDFDWKRLPASGQYVLRVDCRERKADDGKAEAEDPDRLPLLATQSVFIEIAKVGRGLRVTARPPVQAVRPG